MSAPSSVSLDWLFDGIAPLPRNAARVADLTLDSREVKAGSLFFAVAGRSSHGLRFAAEAAARGASVVLWEPTDDAPESKPSLPASGPFAAPVAGLHTLIGRIADRFFGRPSAHLRIVGITGTNGKTTSAYLTAQCLDRLQGPAAYMGTIGWGRLKGQGRLDALGQLDAPDVPLERPAHTTSDAVTVHRRLAALQAQGVRTVAMEVSSHALDQGRVDGVRFHTAAFTNLTRDHLDYHRTMQAYGEAKARLFSRSGLEQVVVNIGDRFGRDLAQRIGARTPLTAVWVNGDGAASPPAAAGASHSLYADRVALDVHGLRVHVSGTLGTCEAATPLLGRFNAENAVVVLACLVALGVPLARAAESLALCTPPPGRMELIAPAQTTRAAAVIDYAHTPDALAKALGALREHCEGALWCVFGCGGDRDPGKRPLMGAIADELADRIIVTDDNPRSEPPERIAAEVAAGISRGPARVIHDRGAAIAAALNEARAGDLVLIAGKGHEDYQITGGVRRPFSDRAQALRHLGAAA